MRTPRFEESAVSVPIVGALNESRREEGRPLIGLAPDSIVAKKSAKVGIDYVGFLAGAARLASNAGYLPVLIPHSYRSSRSGSHNNDRSLCEAVVGGQPPPPDDPLPSPPPDRLLEGGLHLDPHRGLRMGLDHAVGDLERPAEVAPFRVVVREGVQIVQVSRLGLDRIPQTGFRLRQATELLLKET
jgi:hypothetical protein